MDIESFLASQPYTAQTTQTYRLILMRFDAWCIERGTSIDQLTPLDVQAFFMPGWSKNYRHLLLGVIRAYLKWACPDSPVLGMRQARSQGMPGRTLSRDEVNRLVAHLLAHQERRTYRRTLAMLLLTYEGGLRSSEVCQLQVAELDMQRRVAFIRRKGGRKISMVRFRQPVEMTLRQWLIDRPVVPGASASPYLFLSDQGRPLRRGAWRLICLRLGRAAGIKHFSPHALRRSAACRMSEQGASDDLIMSSMGWSSVEVMRLYTRLASLDAIEEYLPSASLELPADFLEAMVGNP